jgi:hypothetical protein
MEGRTQSHGPFLLDDMHSSNLLFPISAWDGLSLGPTDDAVYADVHLGTNEDAFDNALSTYTSPIDSNTYNFDETFTPDNSFDSSLLLNWGLLTMPKLTRNLCATGTALDSSNQREPSESATAQTISSTPMTQLPSWTLNSQTFEVIPNENAPEQPASITNTQRRKTKMKPGTRPCDLKRQKRKEDRPEKCHICQKGHQWRRDLERHYCTHHPDEAAKMGLSMSRPMCRHCGQDFARRDHLTRHLRRKHGG